MAIVPRLSLLRELLGGKHGTRLAIANVLFQFVNFTPSQTESPTCTLDFSVEGQTKGMARISEALGLEGGSGCTICWRYAAIKDYFTLSNT